MEISLAIARHMKMGKEALEVLKYAALLHDIGKVGIRDDVLLKNGAFTPEDWDEMKTHTSKTKSILDQFHFRRHLKRIPAVAAGHHEKMDGRGYHLGLAGDVIPLETRIIAVADMFDAVTSKRDYPKYTEEETLSHDPMPLPRVITLLRNLAGREYDADVVDALICCLPAILADYRGVHYDPEYVDETVEALSR